MPYRPHVKITLNGTLGPAATPCEIFSTGFALAGGVAGGDFSAAIPEAGWLGGLSAAVSAWWGTPSSYIGSAAVLRNIKLAPIGADGKYLGGPTILELGAISGGAGGAQQAAQVARVVTLDTARFPRLSGRMYLPSPAGNLDSDLRWSVDLSKGTADGVAALFGKINALGDNRHVAVATAKGPDGGMHRVHVVRCGRVPDTQRRRRNALLEAYTAASVQHVDE